MPVYGNMLHEPTSSAPKPTNNTERLKDEWQTRPEPERITGLLINYILAYENQDDHHLRQ